MIGGLSLSSQWSGRTVAVFSQGPVGLMATVGARLLGAGQVIAVEVIPNRKELSLHCGADEVVDFEQQDPVIKVGSPPLLASSFGISAAVRSFGSLGWCVVTLAD